MPFKTPSKTSDFIRSLIGKERDADIAAVAAYADSNMIPVLLPETAAFLKQAVILKQPKKILEIGTAIGYSGTIMLKNCDALLYTVEKDEDSANTAKRFFKQAKLEKRVTVYTGDACEIVPLIQGSYDLIFLDGPKTRYPVFYPYLKALLSKGGLLIADNVLFNGMVDGSEELQQKKATIVDGLKKYLQAVFADKDMISSVLPVGDGLCVSIKRSGSGE